MKWTSIRDIFKHLQGSSPFAEIYRDQISRDRLLGRIDVLDGDPQLDDLLPLTLIDDDGGYAGLSLIRLRDITRIRLGFRSPNSTERIHSKIASLPIPPALGMLSTLPIIKRLNEQFHCITVYVEGRGVELPVTGEVLSDRFEPITIREYGFSVTEERAIWLLDNRTFITRIDADGRREHDALRLRPSVLNPKT